MLCGLPEIHENGVSYILTLSYKLAEYLDTWFKHATGFNPQFSLHNPKKLTNELPPPLWESSLVISLIAIKIQYIWVRYPGVLHVLSVECSRGCFGHKF